MLRGGNGLSAILVEVPILHQMPGIKKPAIKAGFFYSCIPRQKSQRETKIRVERVEGIEPSSEAWEATVLPLNYTRSERLTLYQTRPRI